MKRKLKFGFIGTGAMGRQHVDVIAKHFSESCEARVLCDMTPGELEKAAKLAPGAKKLSSWEDALNEDLDAVMISTPNFTHADIAVSALSAGKHVFLEKPVATTTEDCFRILEASKETDRVLMVGHELRYSEYFKKIRELVEAGAIGEPRLIWCKEFRGRFLPKIGNWIQDKRYGGGTLVDKNSHHFDLMNWYLGDRPKAVSAFGGNDVVRVINSEHEVEDNAAVIVEYENSSRGNLLLCMFAPMAFPEPLEFGIFGSAGHLATRMSSDEILVIEREKPDEVEETPDRTFSFRKKANNTRVYKIPPFKGEHRGHSGFLEEHTAFVDAVLNGGSVLTGIEDCIDGTLIPIAAEESIETGETVKLQKERKPDEKGVLAHTG